MWTAFNLKQSCKADFFNQYVFYIFRQKIDACSTSKLLSFEISSRVGDLPRLRSILHRFY